MGHFHLMPNGHLITFGDSDFVGPVHIYGNLGVGCDNRSSKDTL